MARDVAVLAFDGAYLASVGIFLDLFEQMRTRVFEHYRVRGGMGMATRVKLLGQGARAVQVADGRRLEIDNGLERALLLLIHIPDFACSSDALPARLEELRPTTDWLAEQYAGGAYVSATGHGIHLLAQAGLNGGIPAPMSRTRAAAFRARHPHIPLDTMSAVVERGRVLMARGMAHEASMLTRAIGRCMSSTMGGTLAEAMGLQVDNETLSDDPIVAAGQIWLSERSSHAIRISALADHLGISQQTLIRRFRLRLGITPRAYLRVLRMRAAQSQLRDTARPISQIATLVGYDDFKSFQEAFRLHAGMSASRYRGMAQKPEVLEVDLPDDGGEPYQLTD